MDLSSFVVRTLLTGLKVDKAALSMNFDIKESDEERAQILNLEMIITDKVENTQTKVFGEIAICDFVTHVHN